MLTTIIKRLAAVITVLLTSCHSQSSKYICDQKGGAIVDGFCYYYNENRLNFSDAAAACSSSVSNADAKLATFDTVDQAKRAIEAVFGQNGSAVYPFIGVKQRAGSSTPSEQWYWMKADGVAEDALATSVTDGLWASEYPNDINGVEDDQANCAVLFWLLRELDIYDSPCDYYGNGTTSICRFGPILTESTSHSITPPNSGSEGQEGDPHFTTYDGLKFDAQTTCPFVISQPCSNLTYNGPYWSITAKNNLLPGKRVSMLSFIELTILSHTYTAEQRGKNLLLLFKLDGLLKTLPFNDNNVMASISAGQIVIEVKVGIRIRFSFGRQRVTVDGKHNYGTGVLCGMLGDFDGDCTNDLLGRDGKLYATPSKVGCRLTANETLMVEAFADTWIVRKEANCMTGVDLKNGMPLPLLNVT